MLVAEKKPEIIGITESWCYDEILDCELEITGYKLFREDRKDTLKGRGGGVLLYISNSLTTVELDNISGGDGYNLKFCRIQSGSNKSMTVGIVYKSPNISEDNERTMIGILDRIKEKYIVYMGDFNYPHINWDSLNARGKDYNFLKMTQDNFLIQHIDFATRDNNILDLVFSTEKNMVENVEVIGKLGSSDHDTLAFNINSYVEKSKNFNRIPDLRKANWFEINNGLRRINWENELENLSVEESWDKLKGVIENLSSQYIPIKKSRARNKPLWLNTNIMRVIRKKGKLWKTYKDSKDYLDYLKYKRLERETKQEISKAKKDFEKNLTRDLKKNPKKFYAYIRSKTRTRDRVGPLKGNDGVIRDNDKDMCNILNNYFCSVFTRESDVTSIRTGGYNGEHLDNLIIEEDIVRRKIDNLKEGKAPGPDGISPTLLVNTREVISKPLTLIFNKSIKEGNIPRDWRSANVSPIFKKGKRDDPTNYRPVSLTCVVCKILESIVRDRIIDHLDRNKPLRDSQHGFMRHRSCLTNLLEFFEEVLKKVDRGEPVDIIYFDFAKAFDKVSHGKLICKLRKYGISGSILNWVKSWLDDRCQRVVINGDTSSWEKVLSGVPQGSVLGPLLFLIFIDDIDEMVISKCLKFADDTKIYNQVVSEGDRLKIQDDINKLSSWGKDWDMTYNVNKCKVVHLGNNNPKFSYKLNDILIQEVDQEKDLGVLIDYKFKFNEQCAVAAKRGNQLLGIISRNFSCLDKFMFLRLYKSMVRPHLEYAIQAWNPYTRKNINLLEGVQRRATKLVGFCRNLEYRDRLEYLGLTTLETRRLRGDMIQTFKILTGKDRLDRDLFFELNINDRCRGHKFKLKKPRSRLDIRKFSFAHRVVDEWNRLPDGVVESRTLNQFKERIDRYFKDIGKI